MCAGSEILDECDANGSETLEECDTTVDCEMLEATGKETLDDCDAKAVCEVLDECDGTSDDCEIIDECETPGGVILEECESLAVLMVVVEFPNDHLDDSILDDGMETSLEVVFWYIEILLNMLETSV